jgi:L-fuculose-phosphate aldolase
MSPIPDFAKGPPSPEADDPTREKPAPAAPPDPTQPLDPEQPPPAGATPDPAQSPPPDEPAAPTEAPPPSGTEPDPAQPAFNVEATRMSAIPDFASAPPKPTKEEPPAAPAPAEPLPAPAAQEPLPPPPPPAAGPAAPPPATPEPPVPLWSGPKSPDVPLEPPPPDPTARRSDLRAITSPPDPSQVAQAIASAAQAMHREGLVVATTGNVSARDGELIVRITPTALPYDELTAEDIVTLERSGWHSPRGREPSSEHRMHLAIYRARDDVHAIVHTHSPHATAWSFLGEELATGTEDLEHFVGGPVQTSRYAPTGTEEIGEAAVEALGHRRAVLLARHGVVGVGETIREALDACRVVERQAQIARLLRS